MEGGAWSRSGGRGRATAGRRAGARQKRDGGARRRGDRAAHRAGERRFRPDGPSETSRGRGAGDLTRADGAVASRSRRSGAHSSTNTSRIFFPSLSNAPFARRRARAQTRPVVLHVRQQRPQLPTRLAAREYHARVRRRDQAASPRPGQTRAFLRAEKATDKAKSAENPIGRKFSESRTRAAKTAETSTANQSLKNVI